MIREGDKLQRLSHLFRKTLPQTRQVFIKTEISTSFAFELFSIDQFARRVLPVPSPITTVPYS